jgi:hypothetical protein
VPLFTHEYGAPGAPVLFGTENNQLLSAPFARKDDLLLWKTLHLYAPPFRLSWGQRVRRRDFGEPLGYAKGNFAHLWDGYKMNDALLQSTYAQRKFDSLLQYNLRLRFKVASVPAISMVLGLWIIPKILPCLTMAIYTSMYAMAKYAQARIGKSAR